jgi:hypothetical protein
VRSWLPMSGHQDDDRMAICIPRFILQICHPVFIYRSGTSKNKLKHPKDVSPLGPHFQPMRTKPFVNNVIKLENSIGFDQNVTYNTFRRSYSIKLQLFADVPAWKICHSMSHISGDK